MLTPAIAVWDGCHPIIVDAVNQFKKRWRPSSSEKHTIQLLRETIGPAVSLFYKSLSAEQMACIPGASAGLDFGEVIAFAGCKPIETAMRKLLRVFLNTKQLKSQDDETFLATIETLIGLLRDCARKRPTTAKVRDTRLNNDRVKGFCRFCDKLSEFTVFSDGSDNIQIYETDKTFRLSSAYCEDHRPKLQNGDWNPLYQKAKRSAAQFDREVNRLTTQSARLGTPSAATGNVSVDDYIYHYVRAYRFQPADEAEIRRHARLIVDHKLSDKKKQMIVLQRRGETLSGIALITGMNSRQAVSKALSSIPNIFREIPMPA
ncbi:LuxR family transcriptional regulator [Brucella intermedia]|uniref:LuxR family transcriptional regulator n=1 Tax=Brucella intermedia TaxID=94625 RepID=UPI003AB682CF